MYAVSCTYCWAHSNLGWGVSYYFKNHREWKSATIIADHMKKKKTTQDCDAPQLGNGSLNRLKDGILSGSG